jgi:transposase
MSQIHKRFTTDQVRVLLQGYCQGAIERAPIEEMLGISRSRFFALLKEYRRDPSGLSITYERSSPRRLKPSDEAEVEEHLKEEKGLIDDPSMPIGTYNYSAMRDRLDKRGVHMSLSTIIGRAKQLGCYQEHKVKKAHDREVVTSAIGGLIQHDASHHRWSPYTQDKWVLITSLDDYSRKLLYADFVQEETSWAHIKAAEAVVTKYGFPLQYYVDSLRVFRFVRGRDSNWQKLVLQTDEADTQWGTIMKRLGVGVIYALSPQAKGKIERPYRWLQDRIVRTCALEKLTTIDEGRAALKDEVSRYNSHQVHSTTGQIPDLRFEQAKKQAKSLFRPFGLPKPYISPKDVFCLREKRTTNGYGRISLYKHVIALPKVPLREEVEVHLIPDRTKGVMTVRVWWNDQLVYSSDYPLTDFPSVHF